MWLLACFDGVWGIYCHKLGEFVSASDLEQAERMLKHMKGV